MTPLSAKIFEYLAPTLTSGRWVKMAKLERALEVPERGLQGQKGRPGLLDIAIEQIFKEKNMFLVTKAGKGGGIRLTQDPEDVWDAMAKLNSHSRNQFARVRRWQKQVRLKAVNEGGSEERTGQMRIIYENQNVNTPG